MLVTKKCDLRNLKAGQWIPWNVYVIRTNVQCRNNSYSMYNINGFSVICIKIGFFVSNITITHENKCAYNHIKEKNIFYVVFRNKLIFFLTEIRFFLRFIPAWLYFCKKTYKIPSIFYLKILPFISHWALLMAWLANVWQMPAKMHFCKFVWIELYVHNKPFRI